MDQNQNPFGILLHDSIRGYILLAASIGCIATSLTSLIYLTTKMKLNQQIKQLFIAIGIQNLVGFILVTFGILTTWIQEKHSKISCTLVIFPIYFCTGGCITLNTAISVLRYFMVKKATDAKILTEKDINGFSTSCYVIHATFSVFVMYISTWFDGTDLFKLCENRKDYLKPKSILFGIASLGKTLGWLIFGLYFDVKLGKLMIQRKKDDDQKDKKKTGTEFFKT